jgi:hypothetical protein
LCERYAAELVALGPEVIVTGNASVSVAATNDHDPTVRLFNPVGRFVESLARLSLITGFTDNYPPMTGKRLNAKADRSAGEARAFLTIQRLHRSSARLMQLVGRCSSSNGGASRVRDGPNR